MDDDARCDVHGLNRHFRVYDLLPRRPPSWVSKCCSLPGGREALARCFLWPVGPLRVSHHVRACPLVVAPWRIRPFLFSMASRLRGGILSATSRSSPPHAPHVSQSGSHSGLFEGPWVTPLAYICPRSAASRTRGFLLVATSRLCARSCVVLRAPVRRT